MKRRRSSLVSAGHSSNEECEGTEAASVGGDSQSPSLRKQPKRTVKPRYYCDLLDYDSDFDPDVNRTPHSTSPARRRAPGPRNNGKNKEARRKNVPFLSKLFLCPCVFICCKYTMRFFRCCFILWSLVASCGLMCLITWSILASPLLLPIAGKVVPQFLRFGVLGSVVPVSRCTRSCVFGACTAL